LEPPWCRCNHFRHRTESENAPEPRPDCITVVKIPACCRIPGGVRKPYHRHNPDQKEHIQIVTRPFPVDPFGCQPSDGQPCAADRRYLPVCTAKPYGTGKIHLLFHSDPPIDGLRYDDTDNLSEEHTYDPYVNQYAPPSEHPVILHKLTRWVRP